MAPDFSVGVWVLGHHPCPFGDRALYTHPITPLQSDGLFNTRTVVDALDDSPAHDRYVVCLRWSTILQPASMLPPVAGLSRVA